MSEPVFVLGVAGAPVEPLARLLSGSGDVACAVSEVTSVAELALREPEARFVLLTRDPRELAVDRLERDEDGGDDAAELARRWRTELEQALSLAAEQPERVILTAAERLAQDPSTELARLLAALDLPSPPRAIELDPELRAAWPPRWPDALEPGELEALEEAAQPTLTLLGYRPGTGPRAFAELRRNLATVTAERDALAGENVRLREQLGAPEGESSAPAPRHDQLVGEVQRLRYLSQEYEELVAEVQRLRFKASQYDKVAGELKRLRYKAHRYEELEADYQLLRLKARRYDKLRMILAPVRPVVRLLLRLTRPLRGPEPPPSE